MKRSRVTLLGMMAMVVVAALGFAALRVASYSVLKVVYSITLLGLMFAVVASRVRPGAEGAFWLGMAVFGGGYFLYAVPHWKRIDFVSGQRGVQAETNSLLPTSDWVESFVAARTQPQWDAANKISNLSGSSQSYRDAMRAIQETSDSITGIAHLFLSWIFGLIGGLLAVFLRPRSVLKETTS